MDSPSKGQIEAAIKAFEEACRKHEMKGSDHALMHDWYDAYYKAAKLRLRLLLGLTAPTVTTVKRLATLEAVVAEGGPSHEEIMAFENEVERRYDLKQLELEKKGQRRP